MRCACSILACSIALVACAGDASIDPGALELRDVLGIAPQAAIAWAPSQRASARTVIEAGLQQRATTPIHAVIDPDLTTDDGVVRTIAAVDADRVRDGVGALGLVVVASADGAVVVTPRTASTAFGRAPSIDVQLAGWADDVVLAELAKRGSGLLPTLAAAAGHTSGPVVVAPAPDLEMVAAYRPASADAPARLLVNPVVLATLEPSSSAGTPAANPPPGSGSGSARPPNPPNASNGGRSSLAQAIRTGCDSCGDSGDASTDDDGSCDGCGGDDDSDDSSCDGCSGDDGDCSGDGGDCDGGDCSGGDCSGGDCNAAGRRGPHARGGVAPSVAWAVLPLVCGSIVKRRARRRQDAGKRTP